MKIESYKLSIPKLVLFLVGCNAMERPVPVLSDREVLNLESRFLNFEFPAEFGDRKEVLQCVREFRVPGAGMSVLGKITNSQGQSFCIFEIAIPGRSRDLVMVLKHDDPPSQGYQFIHRFIIDAKAEDEFIQPLREIQIESGVIHYYSSGREYKSEKLPVSDEPN